MRPEKILYVDDEAIALKYFERLVGPLAPVLTALSVEEGRAVLREHGDEIAVLVCDQRMPGERGTELLRHARQYHPNVVRMMTTAYSELGEAIDAINTGEIYRYVSKPWELESLRADLKNALELSDLRAERNELLSDKLLAQQSQLLAQRMAALLVLGAAVHAGGEHEAALHRYAQTALACGPVEPSVDWNRWDHADLQQAEARRGVEVAGHVRQWLQTFGVRRDDAQTLAALAQAVGAEVQGDAVRLRDAGSFTALLGAPVGAAATAAQCGWLAWLLWVGGRAQVAPATDGWSVTLAGEAAARPGDWLADAMERLGGCSPA
ncbi:MAG: response regulator [Hydrogenophaga sp.]|jgi:two-component system probable response regulator PhcQ|nr:response regulator [Hydrogenophaga sp.]MDP3325393.1 response regulator [Hydrogenophaga sp.]